LLHVAGARPNLRHELSQVLESHTQLDRPLVHPLRITETDPFILGCASNVASAASIEIAMRFGCLFCPHAYGVSDAETPSPVSIVTDKGRQFGMPTASRSDMAARIPPTRQIESGIRPSYAWECLRCACILTGAADPDGIPHHGSCFYRLLHRDPTQLELFAKLTPDSPA
jgi:hypothetical protein